MIKKDEITEIGKFQKTHALKGELNAILKIDSEFISEGYPLVIECDGIYVPFYSNSVRPKGSSSFLIKLEGIDTEQEAKQFVNKPIYALKSDLAPFLDLDEDDIVDEDELLGYKVFIGKANDILGIIEDIDSSTDNLLLIIRTEDNDTVYVPAVEEFIEEIDDENKIIRLELPEGLIDLNK